MPEPPSSASSTARSWVEGMRPPYISDVRTIAAPGCASRTAASAAAFERPYAVSGSGRSAST